MIDRVTPFSTKRINFILKLKLANIQNMELTKDFNNKVIDAKVDLNLNLDNIIPS